MHLELTNLLRGEGCPGPEENGDSGWPVLNDFARAQAQRGANNSSAFEETEVQGIGSRRRAPGGSSLAGHWDTSQAVAGRSNLQ